MPLDLSLLQVHTMDCEISSPRFCNTLPAYSMLKSSDVSDHRHLKAVRNPTSHINSSPNSFPYSCSDPRLSGHMLIFRLCTSHDRPLRSGEGSPHDACLLCLDVVGLRWAGSRWAKSRLCPVIVLSREIVISAHVCYQHCADTNVDNQLVAVACALDLDVSRRAAVHIVQAWGRIG